VIADKTLDDYDESGEYADAEKTKFTHGSRPGMGNIETDEAFQRKTKNKLADNQIKNRNPGKNNPVKRLRDSYKNLPDIEKVSMLNRNTIKSNQRIKWMIENKPKTGNFNNKFEQTEFKKSLRSRSAPATGYFLNSTCPSVLPKVGFDDNEIVLTVVKSFLKRKEKKGQYFFVIENPRSCEGYNDVNLDHVITFERKNLVIINLKAVLWNLSRRKKKFFLNLKENILLIHSGGEAAQHPISSGMDPEHDPVILVNPPIVTSQLAAVALAGGRRRPLLFHSQKSCISFQILKTPKFRHQ
jgi:hypothetical protein